MFHAILYLYWAFYKRFKFLYRKGVSKMANKLPVGIQVYGLRDLLENTPENTKNVMQQAGGVRES